MVDFMPLNKILKGSSDADSTRNLTDIARHVLEHAEIATKKENIELHTGNMSFVS